MTSKTMKTILFASVIAAMILPFSAMNMAEGLAGDDTRTKTIKVVKEKIKNLEDKKAKSTKDHADLKKLRIADKFLKAKQDNDIAKIQKYSKELHDLKPKDYKKDLIPAIEGDIGKQVTMNAPGNMAMGISSANPPITQTAYSYETWDGTTEYSWDCRDDGDLTGKGSGSVTGYDNSIYVVSNFAYPPEDTFGPQGLNCEERDYEDGVTLYFEFLNTSNGCYSGNHSTETSTTGKSCTALGISDLIEIVAEADYDTNMDFSPWPSHDILVVGN